MRSSLAMVVSADYRSVNPPVLRCRSRVDSVGFVCRKAVSVEEALADLVGVVVDDVLLADGGVIVEAMPMRLLF